MTGCPSKIHEEEIMKNLTVSQLADGASASNFESARALAFSLAESNPELLESELIAWIDRSSGTASPILEGCSGPNGWHDYGVMICRAGGGECAPIDEWTSKLT
jgi:hypothetical protein